jgi:hypothetical protein
MRIKSEESKPVQIIDASSILTCIGISPGLGESGRNVG